MGDNHIVGSVPVQPEDATKVPNGRHCGQVEAKPPSVEGVTKVRLRASMERSDAYKRLPSGAWRVLAALWELADAPRGSEPWVYGRCKVAKIAERTGLSVSQVQRWLRRLRVVPEGQEAPKGWLGGWIDTKVYVGRNLNWTVYATPGGIVEKVPKASKVETRPKAPKAPMPEVAVAQPRIEVTHSCASSAAGMRVEVAHPCASDIPPPSTTAKDHHHQTTREGRDDDAPDGGGGGGAGELDAIRTELRTLGVWSAKVEDLAKRVVATPDGLARLRATSERARREARQPAAFVSKAIEGGTLDDAPKPIEVPHGAWRPRGLTDEDRKAQFKAWGNACHHLFREMTGYLRAEGIRPGETVNGQKGMRYSEDRHAWADLFRSSPAAWRSEVVEVFDDLNRQLAKAGLETFPPVALPSLDEFRPGSAGDAGGTSGDAVESFA